MTGPRPSVGLGWVACAGSGAGGGGVRCLGRARRGCCGTSVDGCVGSCGVVGRGRSVVRRGSSLLSVCVPAACAPYMFSVKAAVLPFFPALSGGSLGALQLCALRKVSVCSASGKGVLKSARKRAVSVSGYVSCRCQSPSSTINVSQLILPCTLHGNKSIPAKVEPYRLKNSTHEVDRTALKNNPECIPLNFIGGLGPTFSAYENSLSPRML